MATLKQKIRSKLRADHAYFSTHSSIREIREKSRAIFEAMEFPENQIGVSSPYILIHGQARQIQEFVEGAGDGFGVGASTVVVKKDDRGVFCPLVGRGNPIPGPATSGGKAKAGAEIFLVRQIVKRFEVQRLETIDLPVFEQPTFLAVRGLDLIGGGARTESHDGAANPSDDDEQRRGEDEGAEDVKKKFIHIAKIPQGRQARGNALRLIKKGCGVANKRIYDEESVEVLTGLQIFSEEKTAESGLRGSDDECIPEG